MWKKSISWNSASFVFPLIRETKYSLSKKKKFIKEVWWNFALEETVCCTTPQKPVKLSISIFKSLLILSIQSDQRIVLVALVHKTLAFPSIQQPGKSLEGQNSYYCVYTKSYRRYIYIFIRNIKLHI